MLEVLSNEGFHTKDLPKSSDDLMTLIMNGPTNCITDRSKRSGGKRIPLELYLEYFKKIPFKSRNHI